MSDRLHERAATASSDAAPPAGRERADRPWALRPFRPPRWARGPHVQTLLARILRPTDGIHFTRERMETPDGDFLDVDWGPDVGGSAPVVVVLHGLEGSSRRRYVRSIAAELAARGARPVAMNFRGCSGEPNRTLRFYHSGDTADASWLIGRIRERHPGRSVGVMGFSLGGNVVLKMLGERTDGGVGLVDAAAVMSVPYDLAEGCALLERTLMGRLYSEYFLRSLRGKVQAKRHRLGVRIDVESARRATSIREFDDRVTAPLNGFRDAADYYAECSSRSFLPGIAVPTLLVHATDDPFLPASSIPRSEVEGNRLLELLLEPRGGHVGFLEGTPRAPRFWADETCAAFLADALQASAEGREARTPPREPPNVP